MKILAFETSCDETSCAVVEDGRRICSNVISTQIAIHKKFGGVVPEIASRHHIEDVLPVALEALREADCTWDDIDAIAVTEGPGLVGALLVGVAAAKACAWALNKPLIAVNHMEGHIFANLLQYPDLEPPFLSLVVSGGHTMLVVVEDYNSFWDRQGMMRQEKPLIRLRALWVFLIQAVRISTGWQQKEMRRPFIFRFRFDGNMIPWIFRSAA